jgi:outer membrane protein OmpA-like peptidoglycan-associated protein
MVLDVYRKKTVRDEGGGKDFEISVLVGQVKVIRSFNNVAIGRILALTSSDDTPVLRYRTVMIGDYAIPSRDQVDTKKDKKISNVNKMIPEKDHKPHSSGSGVLLPSKVLFEFDDWRLKPEAMGVLSTVYDMFNQSKDKDILIEGHTCSLGTDKYNLELSRKRAQSVADYLMHTIGVSRNRIQIKYYGEEFPIASNHIEEGRVKNRRVDIRFLPRGTRHPTDPRPQQILSRTPGDEK